MLKPFHTHGVPGWPFNEFERLLQAAAGSGGQGVEEASAHVAFWNALLATDLHILGSVNAQGRASLPSYGFPEPTGDALVAFTSRELLDRSIAAEVQVLTMPARAFFEMTRGATVALNPSGPYGKAFTPSEIADALAGLVGAGGGGTQKQVTRPMQVMLGQLAVEPKDLIDAVAEACAQVRGGGVRSASLAAVSMPETGDARAHPLIGLDAQDYAAARSAVGMAAERWSRSAGMVVDMVDMNDAQGGALQDHLRRHGKRIYAAKKSGWLSGLLGS